MSNNQDTTDKNSKFDLEDRTLKFSKKLISVLSGLPKATVNFTLVPQGLRSGTSVGANYREANGASSKKDFQNKIFICKKESKETLYWLELIGKAIDDDKQKDDCRKLWKEAKELTLIFSKIASSTKV